MNWRKWLDEFILAGKGILLATKERRFWVGFLLSFIFFGTLMNLLSDGTTKFEMMRISGFLGSLMIIVENFFAIFGVHQYFLDWLPIFIICLLQSTLIGLIVLLWNKKSHRAAKNSENLTSASIITGLIALGAGCPTCGVSMLAPLLGTIFSASSFAVVGTVSLIITWLAIIIAILSLKRLGEEVYVIIVHEKYLAKKSLKESREKNS